MQRIAEVDASAREHPQWNVVLLFGPTLFLSAFLLFWCEPMIGKMMLPLLGGAASVWITCLLFFQLMLLTGYIYAHLLESFFEVRTQIVVHSVLMLAALLFLPIHFAGRPDEAAASRPAIWLLAHLILTVGAPFCIVSTTAPLLQNWLSKTPTAAGRDPYFLYALSNAGSLLALLAYPLFIEPNLGVSLQSSLWFGSYGALIVMVFVASALVWRHFQKSDEHVVESEAAEPPIWPTRLYWTAAAFLPSALMLAVTNHILLNLASAPFLWIIPLAAYLMTFMLAFGRRIRVSHALMSRIVPLVMLLLFPVVAIAKPVGAQLNFLVMAAHIVVLVTGALLCHTALASRRPDPRFLTEFYFWIALGGALGGTFTAVVAPFIFSTVLEYPLLVILIAFFRDPPTRDPKINGFDLIYPALLGFLLEAGWFLFRWASVDIRQNLKATVSASVVFILIAYLFRNRRVRFALALAVLIAGYWVAVPALLDDGNQQLYIARNFFGIKKVVFDLGTNTRKLMHGDTLHGLESQDGVMSGKPLSYYHETGPVGDVMKMLEPRPDQHIGVIGLGTGTIAAYVKPNRRITFFDVDPQVYTIARGFFTFLRRCAQNCDVRIGDGRLSMERANDNEFDLLILDAFNSDSIPAHLVSREAIQTYLAKLKPNGLLMFHVSNRYMNVESLVSAVVADAPLNGLMRYDEDDELPGKSRSDYIVAARHMDDFGSLADDGNWSPVTAPAEIAPWTDDYSNMFAIIRWR